MRYARWILGVMLSASLPLGCDLLLGIEDFSGEEEAAICSGTVNGCAPDAASNQSLFIDITSGSLCRLVPKGETVTFTITPDASCLLRGGIVQSGEVSIQGTNPIEEKLDGGLKLTSNSNEQIKVGPLCVPFFCGEDPLTKRGAIFVQ